MNSVIEDSRQIAEDIDFYEKELTKLLTSISSTSTHRDKLANHHRASDLVTRISSKSAALLDTFVPSTFAYEEKEREVLALTGGEAGTSDLSEFYKRLVKVKEYHRKYPDIANGVGAATNGQRTVDFAALEGGDEEWLDRKFTGEEGLGRYVDLQELHEVWNNLSPASTSGTAASGGWKRLTYLQYLDSVTSFTLSPALKSSPSYVTYLTQLLAYLSNFYDRVSPLGDLDSVLKAADESFSNKWEKGLIKGWAQAEEAAATAESEGIWCSACQKLYSKQTVYAAHLTSKKHVKAVEKLSSGDSADSAAAAPTAASTSASLADLRHRKNRALALKEALITALVSPPSGPLASILADTLSNTERRAALTDRERATEIEELEAREAAEAAAAASTAIAKTATEVDDDDEEGRIYNPLKLPMGWDGKPIPFWLYKLHGLGVEYTCEICSDTVYMGRKVFERHFQEQRHAFGMKALGLPNTKHFHEITKIEDAIALAEKLKQEGKQDAFQTETMEELEDDEGNVYNRKTFEDLKRQGLL